MLLSTYKRIQASRTNELQVRRPVERRIRKRVNRQNTQEVCPFTRKFSRVADEPDYAPRPAWEAEWDRDPDDDALAEATIPTTDGPALVDLMRMSEDEWA